MPEEQERGKQRKLWIASIISAADGCVFDIEPVYKALFRVLYKVFPASLVSDGFILVC
jgi:hypothetical protein